MSEWRLARYADLRVCANGHTEAIPGTERDEREVVCPHCFRWTLDANYCQRCGKHLASTIEKPSSGGKAE